MLQLRVRLLAGAALAVLASTSFANDANSITIEVMSQELSSLRAEVRELRSQQGDNWLSERRAEEVKALVRKVLADADTRASLLESGLTAGHNGKNFFLASEDGSFLMNVKGQFQVRYIANFRDISDDVAPTDVDDAAGGVDEGESGFQLRRTKIQFAGHVGNPKLQYALQLAVNRGDNSVESDKIVVGYQLTDNLSIWAGEDKAPFLREEMISSSKQLAAERSLVNEIFTTDKAQGIALVYEADQFRAYGMFSDGGHSGDGGASIYMENFLADPRDGVNKDFQDDNVDYAFTGRVEVRLAGDWKQIEDFTSFAGEELAVFLGAAVHYEATETGDTYPNDGILAWTVDASVEHNGFNAYVAYVGANIENELEGAMDPIPWAVVAQGGYNLPINNGTSLEPFVRFEFIDLDGGVSNDNGDAIEDIMLWTFGANVYFKKHNAKLTLDVVWAQDSLNNVPGVSDSLGLLQDGPEDEDQMALRAQFQLLF